MTNPVELLSDDALGEIEAAQVKRRESLAFHQSEYPGLPSPAYIEEIDALCATVRALRNIEERYKKVLSDRLREMEALSESFDKLDAENTALREQLARVGEVGLHNAQLIDRIRLWSKCADGYPLDEHINNIATQLAQVTQEWERLRRYV